MKGTYAKHAAGIEFADKALRSVLSTAAHVWIGMWTIGTDYIRAHYFGAHAIVFRITYQFGCLLVLFVYVLWGLQIFWRS